NSPSGERTPGHNPRLRNLLMRKNIFATTALLAALIVALPPVKSSADDNPPKRPALKDAFEKDFMIGVAVNQRQFTEQDTNGVALVKAQFNSISPENILKWESVHPQPDQYDFSGPDRYVEFGEKNHMYLVGHT